MSGTPSREPPSGNGADGSEKSPTTTSAAPSASPIRRDSSSERVETEETQHATSTVTKEHTNNGSTNNGSHVASAVSITPFADRLLAASLIGNLSAFESTLADYRQAKGGVVLSDVAAVSTPTTERGKRNKRSPPTPVDEASRELLSEPLEKRSITATALFWAGYAGHSSLINHLQKHYEAVFAEQCLLVAKQLMDYHKDLAAVSLLVRNQTPAAIISEHRQETALHRLVRRTKPNASLIHELLRTYRKFKGAYPDENGDEDRDGKDGGDEDDADEEEDDVDALNNDGYSALHIVAMHSKGVDGRTAAQVLLSHGADILTPSAKGGNARTLAQNPHVRAALGYRSCPSPAIDAESKRKIDSCASIHDLPPLPDLECEQPPTSAESLLNPQSATEEEKSLQMRTVKKLDNEGVESMVRRLYDQTLQLREEKSAARRQALEPMESRRLTQEEQQAVADRLCNESMEAKEAKHQELRERYIVEPEPNPLDSEQQAESAHRMCNAALEHKQQKLRELDQRYWPNHQATSPKKVLTKEMVRECAVRLHDVSTSQTSAKFEKLAGKYLTPLKSEFAKDKPLTHEEREEARARLTQGRSR